MKGRPNPHKGLKLAEIVADPEATRKKISENYRHGVTTPENELLRRKRISEKRIAFLERTPHVLWFEVNGVKVQGTWEKQVAERLLTLGLNFQRVRIPYDEYRTYTPDFYLPKLGLYIEVKGWMRDRDLEKYRKVVLQTKIDLRIINGKHDLESFVNGKIEILDLPKFPPPP